MIDMDKIKATIEHALAQQNEVVEALKQRKGEVYATIVHGIANTCAALKAARSNAHDMASAFEYSELCVIAVGVQQLTTFYGMKDIDEFGEKRTNEFISDINTCLQFIMKRCKIEDYLK